MILAIPGSLTATSSNLNILKAIAKIAAPNVVIDIFQGLDKLPHFNPEIKDPIPTVTYFKQRIKDADGVIFSTPEYAFGVPGVLKNALDWLVFTGELNEKPVAAISASPLYSGGDKALASLLLTLSALGTNMGTNSALSIADIKNKMSSSGAIIASETTSALQVILNDLVTRIVLGSPLI
ncbi:NAD(P)H-dependent oxidoreductase [Mucilaginibacter flavidus]|uniref:NAD(P)H-dependent oxidoreductase n=1 Tax=Mucilaginibacter flavidus TaxID=2949309 RepID=UPI0020928FFF|nr:NAD(P)H-dependent oxidoreductase [Mucilaginibacter flavidus]MCO5947977.1 NAD(P)H-dependent oxidoreductase [Mucilaginibacter flavidus]